MDVEMKIEVLMSPHPWDDAEKPYYWCILIWDDYSYIWKNSGKMGWGKTPNDAFISALKSYNEIQ